VPVGKSCCDWRAKSVAGIIDYRSTSQSATGQMRIRSASSKMEVAKSLIAGPLPIIFYSASPDDRFAGPRFLGEDVARALGFEAKNFIDDQHLWPSRIHADDLPRILTEVKSLAGDAVLSMEYRWRCADGSERRFLDQGVLEHRDNQARTISGICLDVTARTIGAPSAQPPLRAAATSGSLSLGGVAHEFNNMVSVIIWNLEPLARSLEGSGKSFDRVQHALQAASRCVELIQQLQTSE
jgi:hypothetical protein